MARPSELEEFLQSQIQEAAKDSSGRFTLSRDKALEKLAAFQLQGTHWWVLKIVQAAVAVRAQELSIRQTGTDTEFYFSMTEFWSLEQVEEAFHDPEVSSDPGLDHLKRGLWSVSLHNMRPFFMAAPGWNASLVWTGKTLQRGPTRARENLLLAISHRTMFEGKGIPLLRNIEAASGNAAVLAELRDRAFVCEIPLRVDNRRLDALQACPGYGLSNISYPIHLGFLSDTLPQLQIPPATLGGFQAAQPGDKHLSKVFHQQVTVPSKVAVACLITAHLKQVKKDKALVWQTYMNHSTLFWVRDGVVIDKDYLGVNNSCVSCALFASAEGLRSDLSGFILTRDDVYRDRLQRVCATFVPFLEQAEVSLAALVSSHEQKGRLVGGLMMVGAVVIAFSVPIWGLFLAGGGLATLLAAGAHEKGLEGTLRGALDRLKGEFRRLLKKSIVLPYETQKDGLSLEPAAPPNPRWD